MHQVWDPCNRWVSSDSSALTDSNTERVKEKNSEIVYAKFIEMLDFSDFLKLFQSKTFAWW